MSDWKYDGTTMREVMGWASENVWWIERTAVNAWFARMTPELRGPTCPTLYDALFEAWKAREKGGE